MGAEVQKDIKFDQIKSGDEIVVEFFDKEGNYLTSRRGKATYEEHLDLSDMPDTKWNFEGMRSLYSDETSLYRLFKVEPEPPKNMVRIHLASDWGTSKEKPPVEGAVKVPDGQNWDGSERFHWEFNVQTLEDLMKISKHHNWENLVVDFDENGVTGVTVYDDYLE